MRAQSRPKTQRGRPILYLSPPFSARRPRGDLVTVASVARSDRGEEISPLADGEALGRRARSVASSTAEPHGPVGRQELCSRQRWVSAGSDGGGGEGGKVGYTTLSGDKFY